MSGMKVAGEGLGFLGKLSGLFSVKMLAGMFTGVLLVLVALLMTTRHERDTAQKFNRDFTTAVAGIAGVDPAKLDLGQIIPTLKVIGTDRDTARRERDGFKATAASQSAKVIALGAETARLKAQSNAAVAQAQVVTQQRDHWIAEAKAASTRTTRLPDDQEVKQMEDALDALYGNGF